ncbi:hypothetical protein C6I20_15715 [Aeromicrobium sp. A1-2]|uniref:alpha/beta fold hydrolase n=1 Tax=Aeromicrobium sp. A1-2 TaxID=2107713 RepID=UPI000E4A5552|nr:alpha/beta fold hydrolase [Aeromicrobium sp. A1-2]AXT86477.1 hypothetical protein C6I20_15715 [Aeromicrobium sp. A1-2]
MTTTKDYAPGRLLDIRGDPDGPIVLLWHGRGVDHRSSMHPLADQVAAAGLLALSVDWSSEATDRGRSDLLASLRFARNLAERHGRDPGSVVIGGWSLGGTAAVGVAANAGRSEIAVGGVVLIAPGDGPRVIEPISGSALPVAFPPGAGRCHIDLAYGEHDPGATPDLVTGLELRLRHAGWSTALHAIDADHSSIIGTRYVERTERYLPSRSRAATEAVVRVAAVVAAATSSR